MVKSEISQLERPAGNYTPAALQYERLARCVGDSGEILVMDKTGRRLFAQRPNVPEASNLIPAAAHLTPLGGVVVSLSRIAKDGRFATCLVWMYAAICQAHSRQ